MIKAILSVIFFSLMWQTSNAEVRVSYDNSSPTKGIQEAIDKASSEGGGSVFIPKGTYVISTTIVLPKTGNLNIYGEGSSSIIQAEPEYSSYLSADTQEGGFVIIVRNPEVFKIHDKIVVIDDQWSGEDAPTIATVIDKKDSSIILDAPLIKNYGKSKNARAIHTFHLMITEGFVENILVPNITIRNLQFVGGLKKNFQGFELWQVNGGIGLIGENLWIEDCIIRDIPADAIFVGGGFKQKGNNIWVKDCLVENVGNRGIHIGNSPRNVNVSDNYFNKIGGIGIYFCHGCQRVIVSGNTISNIGTYETDNDTVDFITKQGINGDEYKIKKSVSGIGGLGAGGEKAVDQDKFNVINNNIIFNSKGSGISFFKHFQEEGGRPGENMVISGNNIYNIEKTAIFVFAAQAVQVSQNLISYCVTGIECSESLYCFFTGNTLRNCDLALHFFSKDENFRTAHNVASNNMLINCAVDEQNGKGVYKNLTRDNHIINDNALKNGK
jgi:hypothetical protein